MAYFYKSGDFIILGSSGGCHFFIFFFKAGDCIYMCSLQCPGVSGGFSCLEGVRVVRLNPPLGPHYFYFMWKFMKNQVKC